MVPSVVAGLLAACAMAGQQQIPGGPITLQSCNVMSPVMDWEHTPNKLLKLKASTINACLSLFVSRGGRPGPPVSGPQIRSMPCVNATAWAVTGAGALRTADAPGLCLAFQNRHGFQVGEGATLGDCNDPATTAVAIAAGTSGLMVHRASGLCVEGSIPPINNFFEGGPPCDISVPHLLTARPWCDPNKSIGARVASLIAELKPEEKSCWFGGPNFMTGYGMTRTCGVPRLNISSFQWWHEALHGIKASPGPAKGCTSFPMPIGMSGSFNRTLIKAMSTAIGDEARAVTSAFQNGDFWAPNVNTVHDPRWGRGQETPGEDPYLTSEYAYLFVTGFQGGEKGEAYLKASSCCKHYAVYNVEAGREGFNAVVNDPRDFTDTYLPAFQSCTQRAGSSGVMCAYNAVNGVGSCGNKWLLSDKLRGDFQFDGYVTGDCRAVGDGSYKSISHGVEDTIRVTMEAGTDVDCGTVMSQPNVDRALLNGNITSAMIDVRLANLLKTQFRLGFYNNVDTLPEWARFRPAKNVDTPAHRALALEVAVQAATLLKNSPGKGLPLDASGLGKIAVIGPMAAVTKELLGNYAGSPPYVVSPIKGIQSYFASFAVVFAPGCDINSNDTDPGNLTKAVQLAETADAVVLVIGAGQKLGGQEGSDRTDVRLPDPQNELVREVAAAASSADSLDGKLRPVVVVVISGESLDLSELDSNPNVDAVLWMGYPGQSGGDALASILFGKTNPSGRLPITFFKSAFVDEVPITDMAMRPNKTSGNPGRSYRFYTGTNVVYEFGRGLSYTTFSMSQQGDPEARVLALGQVVASLEQSTGVGIPLASTTVAVKNTGSVAGATSVLCFVKPPTPGVGGMPLKKLVDFAKVFLEPGQSETVVCNITSAHLSEPPGDERLPPKTTGLIPVAGRWTVMFGTVEMMVVVK